MDTPTVEGLKAFPERLEGDAARGEAALDETLFKLALAVRLFDQEQVGLEGAARIAGISQSEMIDRLGALKIPVVRYTEAELKTELDNLDKFDGR